jgi:glycosyltransferase involved in cell wall biosynthesis
MAQNLADAGHEVRFAAPSSIVGQLRPSAHGAGKWLGYIDKFGLFPANLKSAAKNVDIVHICDHSNAFYTRYLQHIPHVVTCHDLLGVRSALGEIPSNPMGWTGRRLQRMISKGLSRAQHIACVSDATRGDLLKLPGIDAHRVSRVYNSLNYRYSPMSKDEAKSRIRKFGLDLDGPFLLHVGGNQWYKNRVGVLRIFSALAEFSKANPFRLAMVGKPWTHDMRQFVVENGMSGSVFELTGVENEDLRAFYSAATMMLFPSLYEGFGWPIVEAQACGCPVATSNRSPMNEIGGSATIYFDPEKPDSAAVILKQALNKATDMREPSIANAARFRCGMTQAYLSLYEAVISEKSATTIRGLSQKVTRASSCPTSGVQ